MPRYHPFNTRSRPEKVRASGRTEIYLVPFGPKAILRGRADRNQNFVLEAPGNHWGASLYTDPQLAKLLEATDRRNGNSQAETQPSSENSSDLPFVMNRSAGVVR